ncbi:hypothetical protein HDV64DRAFT_265615 [Trichoderma sp. TUCIM 5745]
MSIRLVIMIHLFSYFLGVFSFLGVFFFFFLFPFPFPFFLSFFWGVFFLVVSPTLELLALGSSYLGGWLAACCRQKS